MKRVLAIDGGGIRGLIPAVVCQRIEELSGTRISALFDLIAGTSTGGLLAMGLAVPPVGKQASELVQFYLEYGQKIFSKPRNEFGQYFRPKFKAQNLRQAITEVLGSVKLSDAIVDVLVTAYDINRRDAMYFSRDRAKQDRASDHPMRDVAVGTSAAPTVFSPAAVGEHVVIDGGIVANNPACVAYAHAKKLWPEEKVVLVSLGTGTLTRPLPLRKAENWGNIGWARPVIDCLFDGSSQATEDFFRYTHRKNYWRFQVNLSERTESLDDAAGDSLTLLQTLGRQLGENREGDIVQMIDVLRQAGSPLRAKIIRPSAEGWVPPGELVVEGSVENYRQEKIYLFTGTNGRLWPSGRIEPRGQSWQQTVHLGSRERGATITLVSADHLLEDYIEFYRSKAPDINHPGMPLSSKPSQLDRIHVNIEYRQN